MRLQLSRRRDRLEAGDVPLGWKVGFGSPAALERLGLAGPLVGFLTRGALVAPGGSVPVGGWTRPLVEPEIAVHLRAGVAPDASSDEAAAAIGALGPALELADLEFPPDDVETILAGNVYQRAVVLGPPSAGAAGGAAAGLVPRVRVDGREHAATEDPEALTGPLVELVRHVARLLAAFGEELRAGEVVLAGSVVAPLELGAGSRVRFELSPLGAVDVALVP